MMNKDALVNGLIIPTLNNLASEYGVEWDVVDNLEDGPHTIRIHFADNRLHTHLSHLVDLNVIERAKEPFAAFYYSVRRALKEWLCLK
jgi:hypothetical protein